MKILITVDAAFPNHILENTESGELRWETSSREWIPDEPDRRCGSFLLRRSAARSSYAPLFRRVKYSAVR
jgi:hypothetical protein